MNSRQECKSENDKEPMRESATRRAPTSTEAREAEQQPHFPHTTSRTGVPDPDFCTLLRDGKYKLQEEIGNGVFSHVFKAVDTLHPDESFVIKIYNSQVNGVGLSVHAQEEINILKRLEKVDQDIGVVVRLLDHFVEGRNYCLVLEPLATTLCKLASDHGCYGLNMGIVKVFAWQLLLGLAEMSLPHVNIIHADLKPDNIMLKKKQHMRIKIIDFGSSLSHASTSHCRVQSMFYRSPEVILGLQYTTAIDMWSLGCILYELHAGKPLFNGQDELDQLRKFVRVKGPLPFHMVSVGKDSASFYQISKNDCRLHGDIGDGFVTPLRQLLNIENGGPEERWKDDKLHTKEQYELFVDLLEHMMEYDPAKRIQPPEALQHRFFADSFPGCPCLPAVSLAEEPQVQAMVIDSVGATAEIVAPVQTLVLAAPFGNPVNMDLLPNVSHFCKLIGNKKRKLARSSTNESLKEAIIRQIMSVAEPERGAGSKPERDSAKSGSREDSKAAFAGRYSAAVTLLGSDRPDSEEIKEGSSGHNTQNSSSKGLVFQLPKEQPAKEELSPPRKFLLENDSPPWPVNSCKSKSVTHPVVNWTKETTPQQFFLRSYTRCNPTGPAVPAVQLPSQQRMFSSYRGLPRKPRHPSGPQPPQPGVFVEAADMVRGTKKKERRRTRGTMDMDELRRQGETLGRRSVGDKK